ncbi:MAG: hypothetical protein AB1646_16310 [Thermodesulfobacteriota bacterium]
MDLLVATLQRLRRRLGLQLWLRRFFQGLLVASVVSCGWLVLTRCFPSLGNALPVCAALIGVALVITTVLAFREAPSLAQTALAADRRADLKERLISSWELAGVAGPMIRELHEDARRHLNTLDPTKHFPFTTSTAMRWVCVPIALFGVMYALMPQFDLGGFQKRAAEKAARESAARVKAEKLQSVAKSLKDVNQDEHHRLSDSATGIERVARDLQAGTITEKLAFARLTEVGKELHKMNQDLAAKVKMPQAAGTGSGLKGREAEDLKAGVSSAREKIKEVRKRLETGNLSAAESEALEKELTQAARSLAGVGAASDENLAEALSKLRAGLKSNDLDAAIKALESMEMSVNEMGSVLEQLEKTEKAMTNLWETQQALLGPRGTCRICGKKLQPCPSEGDCGGCDLGNSCLGICPDCGQSHGYGPGMNGRGQGEGGEVGPLPDVNVSLRPTTLPGQTTQGKALATIFQRGAPERGAKPSVEHVSGEFVKVRQEAEEALSKEQIPPGSREFVRQYFGTIEPGRR